MAEGLRTLVILLFAMTTTPKLRSTFITITEGLVLDSTSFNAIGSSWNYIYTTLAPKRLMSPGWSGVLSRAQCAGKTLKHFPQARGFLYHSGSGLCTPLLWLEGVASPAASLVTPEEGTIYLDPVICDQKSFLIYEYGTSGHLSCLRVDKSSKQNFTTATSICANLGSFLAEVRTREKRNLISSLGGNDNVWIGLDDMAEEGVFVYHVDKAAITKEEADQIFFSGQPNDADGGQDCAGFNAQNDGIGDGECDLLRYFVCEIPLDDYLFG